MHYHVSHDTPLQYDHFERFIGNGRGWTCFNNFSNTFLNDLKFHKCGQNLVAEILKVCLEGGYVKILKNNDF